MFGMITCLPTAEAGRLVHARQRKRRASRTVRGVDRPVGIRGARRPFAQHALDQAGRRHAVRETFKLRVRKAARQFGLEISGYTGSFSEQRSRLIRDLGVSLVYDVGANVGQYAVALRTSGYTGRLVSVEPNPSAAAALSRRAQTDPLWSVEQVALGPVTADAILNVSENSLSSSLLGMEERHSAAYPGSAYVAEVPVSVRTLDDVVAGTASQDDMLFVKLDVQGYEEAVLAGASQVLSRVVALEVECSLAVLYAGQAPAWQLLEQLSNSGFTAVDVERVCWDARNGDLLQINFLLRRTEVVRAA